MNKEQGAKNKEQGVKSNEKRTCLDCLYCKVSRKSVLNNRLCFCEKKEQKKEHNVPYWLGKTVCRLFDDMTA